MNVQNIYFFKLIDRNRAQLCLRVVERYEGAALIQNYKVYINMFLNLYIGIAVISRYIAKLWS